jgi:hypothetical protein
VGWKLFLACYQFLHAPEAKIVFFALVEVVDIDVRVVIRFVAMEIMPKKD